MHFFHFSKKDINLFNSQHINLINNQNLYKSYINRDFRITNFIDQSCDKKTNYSEYHRSVLVSELEKKYFGINNKDKIISNIESLKLNNTYTVTTGHQLSLFTGPLFFLVKIINVIKLAERLNQENKEINIVPVFWMATEDHDFEEIQSINLYGKKITWDSQQKGPVGRFNLDGFSQIKEQILDFFGNNIDAQIHDLMKVYDGEDLAEATFNLVHELFKDYGLVIIDGDNKNFKKMFVSTIERELKDQFSYKAVSKTNKDLEMDGFKIQAFAREINLFYIENGFRKRIEKTDKGFEIKGLGVYSESEILRKVQLNPECFSPNVVLRPLYQETILPNLAYIGGASEISYWLQLKGIFDSTNITYPIIGIRTSIMWIDKLVSKKIDQIDLVLEDLFKEKDTIKRQFIEYHSSKELNFDEIDLIESQLVKKLEKSILSVDSTMERYKNSEIVKLNKQIEGIKSKLIKLSKENHTKSMKYIDQIYDKLFPNGQMQERYSNIFSFCPDGNISKRIDMLYKVINPEEKDFLVIREN